MSGNNGSRLKEYHKFLESKSQRELNYGFDPIWMPEFLFDFQKYLLEWSIRKGRAAVFADCGLGKGPLQLVWGENVIRKTNKNVIERACVLWSNPGETVLTPFMGVGSEVCAAVHNGRRGIGIELKAAYYRQAVKNMESFPEILKTLVEKTPETNLGLGLQ